MWPLDLATPISLLERAGMTPRIASLLSPSPSANLLRPRSPLPIWPPLKPTYSLDALVSLHVIPGSLPQLHRSPLVLRLSHTQLLLHTAAPLYLHITFFLYLKGTMLAPASGASHGLWDGFLHSTPTTLGLQVSLPKPFLRDIFPDLLLPILGLPTH